MRKLFGLTALLLGALLLVAACADDGDNGDTTLDPTPTPAAADTPAPTPTPVAEPGDEDENGNDESTHAIVGSDYAFEGVPATVAVGDEFTFTNVSEIEVHELVLVRLPDDEERSVEELLELPEEELMPLVMGGLKGVSVAPPASDGMVVEGSLVVDEPGRYIMLCVIPTGADPEEFMAAAQESEGPPDVEGGPPHIVHGMYAEFTAE